MDFRSIRKGAAGAMVLVILLLSMSGFVRRAEAEKMKAMMGYQTIGLSWEETFSVCKSLGFNTVRFTWSDTSKFQALLPKAKAAGLNVIGRIYEKGTRTFGDDHAAWTRYFARLSLKHKNLVAYQIEDFLCGRITGWRSPDNVKNFIQAGKAINPDLKFLPTMYHDAHGGEAVYWDPSSPYKSVLTDGALMWWWHSYRTQSPAISILDNLIDKANKLMPPAAVVNCVYPMAIGQLRMDASNQDSTFKDGLQYAFHHPDTLRKMLKTALSRSTDGIGLWGHKSMYWIPDTVAYYRKSMFAFPKNNDASFSYRFGNSSTKPCGWFQGVTAVVQLPKTLNSAYVSFKMKDDCEYDKTYRNRVHKQLLINKKVVWERRAFQDGTQTDNVKVNVAPHIKGTSAIVTVRLAYKYVALPANLYLGDLSISLNGTPVTGAVWKKSRGMIEARKFLEAFAIIREVFGGTNNISIAPVGANHGLAPHALHSKALGGSMLFGYNLPIAGDVSIKVYDMAGRMLTRLVDGEQNQGYHRAKWSGARSATGVYFVNLTVNGNSRVQRVTKFQ